MKWRTKDKTAVFRDHFPTFLSLIFNFSYLTSLSSSHKIQSPTKGNILKRRYLHSTNQKKIMTSIESTLVSELKIPYLEARRMAVTARASLNLTGYPSPEETDEILAECMSTFYHSSSDKRQQVRGQKQDLDRFSNHIMLSNSRHSSHSRRSRYDRISSSRHSSHMVSSRHSRSSLDSSGHGGSETGSFADGGDQVSGGSGPFSPGSSVGSTSSSKRMSIKDRFRQKIRRGGGNSSS